MKLQNKDKLKKSSRSYCLELLKITRKWPSYLYWLKLIVANHYPQPSSKPPLLKSANTYLSHVSLSHKEFPL